MHKRFGELIDWANNHYDIVILDTSNSCSYGLGDYW
jgi:Mrp family chromosome partitioning ATPase